MSSTYSVEIAPTGFRSLAAIKDKKALREIGAVIDALADGPDSQGKALLSPFQGVRSVWAARGRYRVLYRIDPGRRAVSVLLVGRRRPGEEGDVYALARRLLKVLREGEAD